MKNEATMAEPVVAHYQISERDYVKAGAVFARPTRPLWVLYAVLLLALLAALIWGPRAWRAAALGGAAGGMLAAGLIHLVINPWLLRRHYRRYTAIQQPHQLTLLDDGVHLSNPTGEVRLPWNHVLRWRHSRDYVLLYPMPRLYYLIPARVAEQGFDLSRLKAELTRHVGPPV